MYTYRLCYALVRLFYINPGRGRRGSFSSARAHALLGGCCGRFVSVVAAPLYLFLRGCLFVYLAGALRVGGHGLVHPVVLVGGGGPPALVAPVDVVRWQRAAALAAAALT
eukprot:5743624-Pyramimonas_sp.AAC.1